MQVIHSYTLKTFIKLIYLGLFAVGCVDSASLEGADCPCLEEEGYFCCDDGKCRKECAPETGDDGNETEEDTAPDTTEDADAYCGDGIVQPSAGEECDDGVNDGGEGECQPGCLVEQDISPDTSVDAYCGDGIVQESAGEECDDGINDGGEGECQPGCLVEGAPICDDGTVNDGSCTSGEDDVDVNPTHACGDGHLSEMEACDDGNNSDGDGCSGDCLEVQDGMQCPVPGMPCQPASKCGDGQLLLPETCDDGNLLNDDGCSSTCMLEKGYKCEGSPSICDQSTCGDGIQEGTETCDDGNVIPFDGCSADCQAEPQCATGQGCTSVCGDGILAPQEECDDGNAIGGDGCSEDCAVEIGFVCEQVVAAESEMAVPIILRDFLASHDDFDFEYEEEGDIAFGLNNATEGLVEATLSKSRKPVFTQPYAQNASQLLQNGLIRSPDSFISWFTNTEQEAATVGTTLSLFDDDGDGTYYNRYGQNGEKWERLGESYEGTPVFFPLDGLGITPETDYKVTRIPPNYFGLPDGSTPDEECNLGEGCNPCWPPECVEGDSWDDGDCTDGDAGETLDDYYCYGNSPRHNFYFTTQLGYWFKYNQDNAPVIEVAGDDDFWVFIDGELVIDLGGIHYPLSKTVDLANELDLVDGQIYDLMVFHAKRLSASSTYRLSLSGLNNSRSECEPACGDGVLSPGEECDDGENDGGYGECAPGCVLGEYCGDGILQQEYENCDDGNFLNDDDCPASCRLVIYI